MRGLTPSPARMFKRGDLQRTLAELDEVLARLRALFIQGTQAPGTVTQQTR